jgi:septal ring factor EnvC (AmiA/AmiB activator)
MLYEMESLFNYCRRRTKAVDRDLYVVFTTTSQAGQEEGGNNCDMIWEGFTGTLKRNISSLHQDLSKKFESFKADQNALKDLSKKFESFKADQNALKDLSKKFESFEADQNALKTDISGFKFVIAELRKDQENRNSEQD